MRHVKLSIKRYRALVAQAANAKSECIGRERLAAVVNRRELENTRLERQLSEAQQEIADLRFTFKRIARQAAAMSTE